MKFERVTGVEPVSLPWQGNIITIIRYPHFKLSARGGNRTRTKLPSRDFKSLAYTSFATRANGGDEGN